MGAKMTLPEEGTPVVIDDNGLPPNPARLAFVTRAVACPKCKAEAGWSCISETSGKKRSPHKERILRKDINEELRKRGEIGRTGNIVVVRNGERVCWNLDTCEVSTV